MSIIRKVALSAASVVVGITGMMLTVSPSISVADCGWETPVPCAAADTAGRH
ncbi:hypothetical protein [Actinophytocola sp.]|uniref:hypothetical protein n=1 Tax=Actinophytocola sp. TaxID=1872138 RepID=UPI003D6C6B23